MPFPIRNRTPFRIANHVTPDQPRYDAALQPMDLNVGTLYQVPDLTLAQTLTHQFTKADVMEILVRDPSELDTQMLDKHFGSNVGSPPVQATAEEVTIKLEQFLRPSVSHVSMEVRAALRRLNVLSSVQRYDDWGADVIYKAFKDVDTIFFNGMLRYRVRIVWRSADGMVAQQPNSDRDMSNTAGICSEEKKHLNMMTPGDEDTVTALGYAKMIFLEPFQGNTKWDNMWGVLLHEMVHAYLHTQTSEHAQIWLESDKNKHHGEYFERCIRAVNQRTKELPCFRTAMDKEIEWHDTRHSEGKDTDSLVKDSIKDEK